MRWVIEPEYAQWSIRRVEGMHSRLVARVPLEEDALRITALLNRHGMADVPLEGIEGA